MRKIDVPPVILNIQLLNMVEVLASTKHGLKSVTLSSKLRLPSRTVFRYLDKIESLGFKLDRDNENKYSIDKTVIPAFIKPFTAQAREMEAFNRGVKDAMSNAVNLFNTPERIREGVLEITIRKPQK